MSEWFLHAEAGLQNDLVAWARARARADGMSGAARYDT